MDQTDHHQNLQSLTQFTKYHFLKKITQLLLSVSVFSLLLSNSSRLSFLPAFSFSTVPFQLFTHTIDKNCIFLLCNGLLVFVAKFSGSISSSSSPKNNYSSIDQPVENYHDYQPLVLEEKVPLTENEQDKEIHQDELEENGNGFLIDREEEKESDEAFVQEDYRDQGEVIEIDDKFPILDDQQDDADADYYDYEDEEENGMLSTEELNKKFEEFIRKMKEEIRIEAQHQLVVVN